ncbi:hypothetical protein [Clostridium sp.]|uniref:hypothetical protein n=1 Tax=Clostridium sp. TaxID=1506 RepID=UPI0034638596
MDKSYDIIALEHKQLRNALGILLDYTRSMSMATGYKTKGAPNLDNIGGLLTRTGGNICE